MHRFVFAAPGATYVHTQFGMPVSKSLAGACTRLGGTLTCEFVSLPASGLRDDGRATEAQEPSKWPGTP